LSSHLKAGDVLVFNDSKVIPARLKGFSTGREYEVLLVKKTKKNRWECWVKPGRRLKDGQTLTFSQRLEGIYRERIKDIFIFEFNLDNDDFYQEIEKIGQMPIPPYILKARSNDNLPQYAQDDLDNYQTIFASKTGSVAAPTAGLHFNSKLLEQLNKNGIQQEMVTLHVSLGTFQPVTTEKVEDFQIHSEYFEVDSETAKRLNKAKMEGRRIIAVGTTSVRVLESVTKDDLIRPTSGETNIYIYPKYEFKFVDGIVTNFHLPKSSLLLLVSAFATRDQILMAYDHAIKEKYQFYSYGDGMLII
jgi:S-adenosylmethionine:tRNA ribosyltransferase-isomerase